MKDDIISNQLWVNKHRPKEVEDVILNIDQKNFLKKCISSGEIPHTLLYGPPGSGKTTCARILVSKIISDETDVLELNGSLSRKIGDVREMIEPFLCTPPMDSKIKIVFIDEFDYMTTQAQASLRSVFEKYEKIGRFLCTANYFSKIEPALISRFQSFEFKSISKDYCSAYIKKILTAESIKYNDDAVELCITKLLPDVRKIINVIQENTYNGEFNSIDEQKIKTQEKKIVALIELVHDAICTKDINKINVCIDTTLPQIQKIVDEKEPDYISVYHDLFINTKINPWAKIVINDYSNKHTQSLIPSIHFIAMILQIIENGKIYNKYIAQ